jgi:HK97 family phage major capsid protein
MKQLIIAKQEQLRQISEKVKSFDQLRNGLAATSTKEAVPGRDLTPEEKTAWKASLDEFDVAEAELEDLMDQQRSANISRMKRPAKSEDIKLSERYDYLRAVRMACEKLLPGEDAGVEKEMDQEAQRMAKESNMPLGGGPRAVAVGVPAFIKDQKRATFANAANAGNLGQRSTDFSMVDFLMPETVLESAGAKVMTGLVGTIDLPFGNAIGQYGYNTENGSAAAPGTTFQMKTIGPKRGATKEPVSMTLMNQTSFGVEQFFTSHFAELESLGLERVAAQGGGVNEPIGLIATGTIPSVAIGANGGALTEDHYDALIRLLKINNGVRGPISAITTPAIAARMGKIKRDTGSGIFLLNVDTNIAKNGVRVFESNQLPTNLVKGTSTDCHPLIVGDFSRLYFMKWAFSSFIVDPYTSAGEGNVNLIFNSFNNVFWTHDKTFAQILDSRDI